MILSPKSSAGSPKATGTTKVLVFSTALFAVLTGVGPARADPPPQPPEPPPQAAPAVSPPLSTSAVESVATAPVATVPKDRGAPVGSAPVPLAETVPSEQEPSSWFFRPPLTLGVGDARKSLTMTFFGFVEADYITDSTRSYGDAMGSALVARSDTYAGRAGRSQFSVRNTRLGLMFESPIVGTVRSSAVLEGDFFGNPATNPASNSASAAEAAFYTSPTFRLRQAYLLLRTAHVDLLAGQSYDVFGWQNLFFPCTVQFLGLPNQLFSRNTQVRLSRSWNGSGAVSVDVAVAAVRPAQRDAQIPDANLGVRVSVNRWKGITTPGNVGTVALPLSIGVSGTVRQYKVNAFTPPPTQNSNSAMGWGLSVDVLVPIIPAANAADRGNRLTLVGSFVTGTGIGDLITAGGGASFPTLPNPAQANPPPLYTPNIDNGLVSFDTQGVVHTIDWQAFRVGLQYYLPPSGRFILSVNYTQAHSTNMAALFPRGGAEIELLGRVADKSRYADANLFWDATPAIRFGLSGQYTSVDYLDGDKPHNLRAMSQALYAF